MAKLPTIFKREGGTVTAGNASGMNDAGAAVVLMSDEKAAELGAPGARADPGLRVVRRRPGGHGHRAGAGGAQGARPRRAWRSTTSA